MSVRIIPVALALLWGLNWPAVKIALSEIPPFALRTIGLGVGALLLLGVAAALGRPLSVAREAWGRVLIAGGLNIAGFNIATAFAQLNTTTSRAAILTFTTPLWSVLFATIVLDERLDRARTVALAIGAVGIAILAVPLLEGQKSTLGLILPIVAAVAWAAGTVYQKAQPVRGDKAALTAYQLLMGAAIAGVGWVVMGETLPLALSTPVWTAMGFHVVCATAMAYLLWFILLDRMPAGAASITTFAIPVVGVLSAMALVGDRPSALDWVGFSVVMGAAAIAMFAAGGKTIKRDG